MASSLQFTDLQSLSPWSAETETDRISCSRMHDLASTMARENAAEFKKRFHVSIQDATGYDIRAPYKLEPSSRFCALRPKATSAAPEMQPTPVSKHEFLAQTRQRGTPAPVGKC